MKIKIFVIGIILAMCLIASTCTSSRSRPEASLPIQEVQLLKYEAIDFNELLTKQRAAKIETDRDPFKSPFRQSDILHNYEVAIDMLGVESLSLIGIIRGPKGSVALIKSGSKNKTQEIRERETMGKFYVEEITDKQVILNTEDKSFVLNLGGGKQ